MDQIDAAICETWGAPPSILEAPREQVHVWRVPLDLPPADGRCLAPDEQARAERLIHPESRQRFIAMRSAARSVLGRYLQIPPNSVSFVYGEKGKPSLDGEQNMLDLRFNLSHSGNLGILAVTCGQEVGIDIETRQRVVDYMAIARRFFSSREYEGLTEVPGELRERAFLRCWTRKESYIKALGKGLAHSLQAFSVSVSPDVTRDALLDGEHPGIYHVSDLVLPDECYAALTLEGEDRSRCCWTYGSRDCVSTR